jgi:hypothetical protein
MFSWLANLIEVFDDALEWADETVFDEALSWVDEPELEFPTSA